MISLLPIVLTSALAAEPAVLMVGNSYTARNNLSDVLGELMIQEVPGYSNVSRTAITPGGYTFSQHLADADGTRGETALRQALVTGDVVWDTVFLQEQSQTAGFPQTDGSFLASHASALALDEMVAAKGAQTVFYMTWGRRDGDSQNPSLYPDFNAMQDKLAEGYLVYAAETSTVERPVYIAPAGYAFRTVWNFYALYTGDGSHPSMNGTYLIAATMLATLTGREATSLANLTDAGVSEETQIMLSDVAKRTVLDDPLGELDYPWVYTFSDWSGVIAGDTLLPLVWLDEAAEAGELEVGSDLGAGRLWLEANAALTVDVLHVGATGPGAVQQRGTLVANEVHIGTDGTYDLKRGTLQVNTWAGDLTIPEKATWIVDGHSDVVGDVRLNGTLSFVGDPSGNGHVAVSANHIVLGEVVWDLPEGWTATVEGSDGGEVLVLSNGDAASGDLDETGCGCQSGGANGWWGLIILGLFSRRKAAPRATPRRRTQ